MFFLILPETPYIVPLCLPNKVSNNFAIGQASIYQNPIRTLTGIAKNAPIARPCREQTACGIISANITISAVEIITATYPVK